MKWFCFFTVFLFGFLGVSEGQETKMREEILNQCPEGLVSVVSSRLPYVQNKYRTAPLMESWGKTVWTPESADAPPLAPVQKGKIKTKLPFSSSEDLPFPLPTEEMAEQTAEKVEQTTEMWFSTNENAELGIDLKTQDLLFVIQYETLPTPENPYPAGRLWKYNAKNELDSVTDYDGSFQPGKSYKGYAGELGNDRLDAVLEGMELELGTRYLCASQFEGFLWIKTDRNEFGVFFIFREDIAKDFGKAYLQQRAALLKKTELPEPPKMSALLLNPRVVLLTDSTELKTWFTDGRRQKDAKFFNLPPNLAQQITEKTRICHFRTQEPECVWQIDETSPSEETLLLGSTTVSPNELAQVPQWKNAFAYFARLAVWEKVEETEETPAFPLHWFRWTLPTYDPNAFLLQDGESAFTKMFLSSIFM